MPDNTSPGLQPAPLRTVVSGVFAAITFICRGQSLDPELEVKRLWFCLSAAEEGLDKSQPRCPVCHMKAQLSQVTVLPFVYHYLLKPNPLFRNS